jgi:hypothetical protein
VRVNSADVDNRLVQISNTHRALGEYVAREYAEYHDVLAEDVERLVVVEVDAEFLVHNIDEGPWCDRYCDSDSKSYQSIPRG